MTHRKKLATSKIVTFRDSTAKMDGPLYSKSTVPTELLNGQSTLETFHSSLRLSEVKKINSISGGYNCTCNEGYSGSGKNIEIMDVSEIMIQKPGCVQNRQNATQPTQTTPQPMIPLVNLLYNSSIAAKEKSNDTLNEVGAILNSNSLAIQFNALVLTFYAIFV